MIFFSALIPICARCEREVNYPHVVDAREYCDDCFEELCEPFDTHVERWTM